MSKLFDAERCSMRASYFSIILFLLAFLGLSVPEVTAQGPEIKQAIFDIPPQPLSSALVSFSETADVELVASSGLTQGIQTQGLSGSHTTEEGLKRLLSGTGLTYRFVGPRSITLERDGSAGAEAGMIAAGAIGAAGIGAAAGAAVAGADDTNSTVQNGQRPVKVPEVVVKEVIEKDTAVIGNLPPDYAGEQVASGARLGMLGNRDVMDTPFNVQSYTNKLIRDQQAQTLANVLINNASTRTNLNRYSNTDQFVMRGFRLQDTAFDGLYGIAPFLRANLESMERVEILLGPSALLNGASPEGAGLGTVNYIPKRAGDTPITRFIGGYYSDSVLGGHLDVGRRFGKNNEFGARVNLAYRNGEAPIDLVREESATAAVALDYRSERFRATTDLGFQKNAFKAPPTIFGLASGIGVPKAPDASSNVSQSFEKSQVTTYYGMVRGEVDVTRQVTLTAAYGAAFDKRREFGNRFGFITSSDGEVALSTSNVEQNILRQGGEVGLKSKFDTGIFNHAVAATINMYRENRDGFGAFGLQDYTSNIYNPVRVGAVAAPSGPFVPNSSLYLTSYALADTVSLFSNRVQLMLGGRFQRVQSRSYDGDTGAQTAEYDKTALTPALGFIVKPVEHLSLYANYIQGLAQGPQAPITAVNANEVFSPFVSEQIEFGAKYDFGRLAATISFFQITQPSAFTNPNTNVFSVAGETRNRGIELNTFGEVTKGVRALGGVVFYRAELTQTEGALQDGHTPPGVPRVQLNFGGEWDLPFLPALTLTGRTIYTSSQFADQANTQQMASWVRVDLGARYAFTAFERPLIARLNVDNAFDKDYWQASADSFFSLGPPRTVLLSIQADF